jgi:hypothetical protein
MEICPDYQFEDPHMFIIIKSNGLATKMIVANWDRANELGNSKREWFGKFGTLVCDEGLLCNYLENARSVCWRLRENAKKRCLNENFYYWILCML